MPVLRLFTSPADVSFGSLRTTTDTTFFDPTRVDTAFKVDSSDTFSVAHAASPSNDTWYHFRWAGSRSNAWNLDTTHIEFLDSNNLVMGGMDITGGRLRFYAEGNSRVNSTPFLYSQNTQYTIDIHVVVNGTTDVTLNPYINSAPQPQVTAPNTNGSRGKPITFRAQHFDDFGEFYISEGIIMDEDTRGMRLRELKPQSFGVDVQWAGAVSDVTDNDLATGISTDTDKARTSFGVTNLENVQSGDIINRIVAQSYAQRGATGLTRFNHYYAFPGDTGKYDEPDITLTTAGTWYITESLVNPKTTQPWLPTDLAGIQLGVRAQT